MLIKSLESLLQIITALCNNLEHLRLTRRRRQKIGEVENECTSHKVYPLCHLYAKNFSQLELVEMWSNSENNNFAQFFLSRLGIPIPGSRIPGSRDPGPFSQSRIPGFRDYEKCKKCPNFTGYLPEKYFFPEFWGQFPALKLRVSGFNPNTNYVIMVDIVLRSPLRTLHLGHISSLMLAWCKEGTVSQVLSYWSVV